VATYVAPHKWRLRLYPRRHGGAVDQPSDFYSTVKEELAPLGIEPSWSFKYNAGANPIAFPITFQHAAHSKVLEVLEQAYGLA
jgi:hypothetical protein